MGGWNNIKVCILLVGENINDGSSIKSCQSSYCQWRLELAQSTNVLSLGLICIIQTIFLCPCDQKWYR